ncbi:repressor LexA [delta proteobacterium NaphS2]|nr:repressor LexA [delta proteobacterium NaphS2]
MKLTRRQKEVLSYISQYIDAWRKSPSFEEVCSHFGFASYNTVSSYLNILERKGYIRRPKEKNKKRVVEVISPVETRRFEFPLLGRVAAGAPIEAIEDVDVVEVPPSMANEGDCFVLQVKGVSMEEDGILDGDFVVIRKQATAKNGEIVVALADGGATVKRYYRYKNYVELRPSHGEMPPIRVQGEDFHIEGKVVGVMRYYR